MNRTVRVCMFTVATAAALAAPASAHADRYVDNRASTFEVVQTDGTPGIGPVVGIGGNFGNRHGIDGNDYSLYGLLPWHIAPNGCVVFVVLRAGATDEQNPLANFGVGCRRYVEAVDGIFGVSGWYDFDESRGPAYQRAGGQLEFIGRRIEVRGGADILLAGGESTLVIVETAPQFQGHNIVLGELHLATPYDHGYVELGGPLPILGQCGLRGFGGAYYLWADNADQTVGWQTRLALDVSENFQVGARLTSDDVFGTNASCNVAMAIPLGGISAMADRLGANIAGRIAGEASSTHWFTCRPVAERLNAPVVRDYRVPVHLATDASALLATDPATGEPIVVAHVDPNSPTAGNGTIESPFASLEAARLANNPNVDVIRVVPPDDAGTHLVVSAPLELFAGQRLLSSSIEHEVMAAEGRFGLPGFIDGASPIVSNSAATPSAVVVLADDVEVSGFTIDGGGRHVGLHGQVNNFDVNGNTVHNASVGLQVADASGTGVVAQNVFRSNLNDGVNIVAANDDALHLTLAENTIIDNGDDGLDVLIDGAQSTITLTDNDVDGNGDDGFALTSRSEATIHAKLRRNRLGQLETGTDGNGGAGLHVVADSGFAHLTIGGSQPDDGNVVVGNGGQSIAFELTGTAVAIVNSRNNVIPAPATGANSFDIALDLDDAFTPSQRAAFAAAAQRWESIIIGDLPNIGSIDDVRITAVTNAIDGLGGTLAEAGPAGFRSGTYLPFAGTMTFDSADLLAMQAEGKLEDVILHEMAHVLGFGTIWEPLALVDGAGGDSPRFNGAHATAEYSARFGLNASGVPLEDTGDDGTIGSHWRETDFTNELMTGFIDGANLPISRITIGQFIDLGYEVDMTQADPF